MSVRGENLEKNFLNEHRSDTRKKAPLPDVQAGGR